MQSRLFFSVIKKEKKKNENYFYHEYKEIEFIFIYLFLFFIKEFPNTLNVSESFLNKPWMEIIYFFLFRLYW
jgi:hypothetical protein